MRRDFYSPLDRIPEIIADLTGKGGTRVLGADELAVAMGEMPTISQGYLPSQRRVQTAVAAIKELRGEELQIVLQSLAQIKGPVWGASQLRQAAAIVEGGK